MNSNQPVAGAAPPLTAERYRVERMLGRGGMAAVYEACDTFDGRIVALKRLLQRDVANAHIKQLFELEYHTLSQLVHPGIVEVYDYHADAQGAFYTMELLSGGDLRERTPVGWHELCHRLCDVASALALLHSRRFVHRDLTPLNVRCTLDGGTKLFDFGSMAPFGRTKHIVGTPPFIAPEALNGEVVDGQTDLYSLGATAYYALTGRQAYPARALSELPDLWHTLPVAPSQLVPGIPAALDDLVMALLSLSPRARPPSAADVIERLSAIGGFEIREALVAEAYLMKPALVGRDEPLAAMARILKRLADRHGSAVLVSGAPGTGRSRLLDACALEAKLSRALVLRSDAQGSGGPRWGGAIRLLEQLSLQLPELSARLLAMYTAQLSPLLLESSGDTQPDGTPGYRISMRPSSAPTNEIGRAEIQTALQEFLLEATQHRPLVIVVDDIDRVDEPTAALLALLANQAHQHRILVIGSITRTDEVHDESAERALQLIAAVAESWRLHNLDISQSTALIVSLFGDVPNVRLLADRVFGVTGGNPLLLMRVAQHLVDSGACGYAAGTWSLPASWNSDLVSGASRESIDDSLPGTALELARSLALCGLSVSLGECLQLSGHANLKQLHADLHKLVASGIVTMDDDEIGLSRPSWERLLLDELDLQKRQLLHLRVAEVLDKRPSARFRVIQHVLQGGEVERALDLQIADNRDNRPARIADPVRTFEYLQSLPRNWPETYHTLIEACARLGRPLRERLELQVELLAFAALAARSERETVLELAERLRYDTGLDLIAELEGRVAASDLLMQALGAAQRRYNDTPERERGLPLVEALTALGQLTIQAIAMAGRALDLPLLRAMPSLAPLTTLSPALAVVQKNLDSSIATLTGQGMSAKGPYLEIVSRLDEPDGAGLGNTHRLHMRSAVLWAVGTIEADLGRPSALDRAAAIESNPLFALSALQLRCMYMLVRGDRASAERYREQAELLQIQNCPPQMFQGTQLLRLTSYYAAIGDLLRVKLCVAELEAMARDLPAWRPIAHYGRGTYQTLRGDHAQAQAELEQGLALMSVGNHVNWAACAGALLAVLVRLERYQEAVERGRLWLASVHTQQLQVAVHPLLVPVALAEGCLGQADAAVGHIREAIDVLSAEQGGGVLLGEAFEVHARIALQMADAETFERCAKACETEYRFGSHPALLARLERLHRRAYEVCLVVAPAPNTSAERRVPSFDEIQTNVSTLLRSARASGERAERALRLIGDVSHCNAGFLYLIKPTGPTLVAQVGGAVPWADMDEAVKAFLESSHESDVTQSTVPGSPDLRTLWSIDESTCFMPMLLSHTADRSVYVTGVAVMAIGSEKSVYPPARLLQVLSKSLSDAGDVVTQHTAQLRPYRIQTTGHASLPLGASPSIDFIAPVPGNPISRQLDMTNPHPWLDVSAYPILVVRYPANADRPEAAVEVQEFYDAFCAWADSHQAPYTVIADTTAMKTIPSALVRAAVAKGEARTAEFEARLNQGTAVIVTNAITRGVATAVFWLSPPAYPMRLFTGFDDALAWVLTRLDGAGLQRPPTLPHAI